VRSCVGYREIYSNMIRHAVGYEVNGVKVEKHWVKEWKFAVLHTLGVALQIMGRWNTRVNLWYDLSLWFLLRRKKILQVILLIAECACKVRAVYTTRLSVLKTVERWALRWTVNGTLERVWKEAVPAWLRYCLEGLRKTTEINMIECRSRFEPDLSRSELLH